MNRRQRLLRWGAATVGSARASVQRSGPRQRLIAAAVASIVAVAAVAGIVVFAASSDGAPDRAAGSSASEHSGKAGNADFSLLGGRHRAKLAPATSSPAPAPASLATAAPLASHEVFGFAPYWTLGQSTTFDVAGLTTIAYFSVDINPDGTLDESGSGWNGYQSQDLVNLIDRAHAAGVRVVLTVDDFDQQSLDQLTSSPTAPATLAQALIGAVEAKDLDGVNLDLEGDGSADQAGLTNLVGQVSTALHQVNPHWQVTMDTYASSAGDPNGFYDIPALANVVDGFFVMQYSPNLSANAQATSPLTSSLFNDVTTAGQYAAAVPASKVILGAPLFGLDWPTNGDTLTAAATGPVTDLAYSQIATAGHPTYWDPVTDSAWTAYQVGTQWHESFFDDPTSLYDVSQLAHLFGLAGTGVWALGMDGSADAATLTALGGTAPSITYAPSPGTPTSTTTAPANSSSTTTSTVAGGGAGGGAGTSPVTGGTSPGSTTPTSAAPVGGGSSPTTTATTAPSTSTSTTAAPGGGTTSTTTPSYTYTATWGGQMVTLDEGPAVPPATLTQPGATNVGTVTHFTTDDPALSCLNSAAALAVWELPPTTSSTTTTTTTTPNAPTGPIYTVVAAHPEDCAGASFTFVPPLGSTTTTTTTTGS